MSKEEFIRQRDAYRVQEDEKMEQIQRLRTEKNQIFQPVKKDTDNLQAVMDTVGGAGAAHGNRRRPPDMADSPE